MTIIEGDVMLHLMGNPVTSSRLLWLVAAKFWLALPISLMFHEVEIH